MRIAFTGHKESGKSTCTEMCRQILGGGIIVDMMRPLRTGLIELIGNLGVQVPIAHFYDSKTPESRSLLQAAGNYIRSLDKDALIKYACQVIDCARPDVNIFIENMRMKNEEAAFRQRGFTIAKVIRPGFDGDTDATETEIEQIKWDYTIFNDNDLTYLQTRVVLAIDSIRGCVNAAL